MKHFFKLSSFLFLLSIGSHIFMDAGAYPAAPASQPIPSVHEMFKDIPQDELLQMMEEGQQFIKYLEEHGTPEEKMAFAQAMEETLQGFTEDDWREFEQIVETVQDKLPPLAIEPPSEVKSEPIKEEIKKEEPKVTIVDNSLEKILHAIHKAINALLLKAKSDKILTERITINWDNKDNFNEMNRLLQTLNKKDHIIKLTTSKDEAIKTLFESIQNFNTRLQMENDQFIIADTFGLQADEKTTAINLKKLNKILEFFDNAIEALLPKLIKFMQEYEPEALKIAQIHDESAKKALEHATKVEKQKRPIGGMSYQDRSPLNGSRNTKQSQPSRGYPANYNQGMQSGQSASQEHRPNFLEQVHRENLKNIPQLKKSTDGKTESSHKPNEKPNDKKETKKSEVDNAIDNLESYLEANSNTEVNQYITTINKTNGIYTPFGTPINDVDKNRFKDLQTKRSTSQALGSEELRFLQKYEEQWRAIDKDFEKNTAAAHAYYASLNESISNISPQIDEMQYVLQSVKSSLSDMNSKELEKLNNSSALKSFAQRINNYHAKFKNAQQELKNKHRLHRLEGIDASVIRAYDELVYKIETLHGLDRKINDVKSQLESLYKSIKSATARRKREEHKAAQNKN